MKFAMKPSSYAGRTDFNCKTVVLKPDDPHLPGYLHIEERRALLDKHQKGELTKEQYEMQLKEIVKQHRVNEEKVSRVLLNITVSHGGYVIMHGESMQKYYQVSHVNLCSAFLPYDGADIL